MTPQPPPDSAERAEFEAHCARERMNYERNGLGGYSDFDTNCHWITWQAARSRPAPPAAEPPLGSLAYKLGLLVEMMDEEIAERERKKLRGSVAVLRAFRNQVAALSDEVRAAPQQPAEQGEPFGYITADDLKHLMDVYPAVNTTICKTPDEFRTFHGREEVAVPIYTRPQPPPPQAEEK